MRTMLRTLGIILSLRNTININEILSGIRHIPIVGKKIPARVHGVRIIKILAMIPSVITELFKAFFGPLCLFGFLFVSSATLGSLRLYESRSVYLYLFLIISLMGVFFNNNFRFSTEVKYAVFYMGMDAKKYVLVHKRLHDTEHIPHLVVSHGADAAVLVRVDHSAGAQIGEHLPQENTVAAAVQYVDAGDTGHQAG